MDEPAITRVFISYSHDSAEHRDRVRRLADRLIRDGVDCVIDLDEPNPPEGWWRWMDRQLADADFVLVVCTAGYFQRATARRQAAGHGARFESVLLIQTLYDSAMENKKFIPVLFEDLPTSEILPALRPYSRYRLDRDAEYTELLRHLTGQPKRVRPPRGPVPELPPEETGTAGTRIDGTMARPEAPRQQTSASGRLQAALPPSLLRSGLPQRWRHALLGGPLRRRIVQTVAALALLAASGVGAARWLCASRAGLGVQVVGIRFLSFFCTPKQLYDEGVKSWEILDIQRARQLFEKAIAKRPDYWLAYSGLAAVLHELGQDDLAARNAKLACDNAGNLPREDRLVVTARCAYIEHRWSDAINSYGELRSSFPDAVEHGLGLVKALWAGGRSSDALDAVHSLQAQPSMAAHAARLYLAEAEVASDYDRMYTAAVEAQKHAERQGGDQLRARALLLEGIALSARDPENALTALKEAKDLYEHTGDRPNQAQALDAAAEVLLRQGRLSEARGRADQALEIFKEVGDRDGQAHQHRRMAVIEFKQGNDTEAENLFATAIGDFRLAGNRSEEARYTSNLGFALYRSGHHEEAVKHYQQALGLYRQLEDRSGEAQQLIYLADVSLQELSIGEAEARLAAAKDLATAVSNHHQSALSADILAREGDVAAVRGQPDVARERYLDAQAQHAGTGDTSEVAQGDLRLAGLELDQCEITLAGSYARKALEQFHHEHVEDQEAQAGAVLAMALVAAGSHREAESAIEKAERLANNSRDPDVKIEVELAGGRLHAAAGKPEEALHQLDGAIEQARRAGLRWRVLEVRLARGEIEVARGDRRHAAEDLTSLEKEARSHGFSAIADRAARVRAGGPAGACHSR